MKPIFLAGIALTISLLCACKKQVQPTTYEIGQEAFGGIVVKTDATKEHGLVVAKENQVAYGSGNIYSESVTIVENYAAGGTGWRIPTKDELLALYSMKSSIGGFTAVRYWSSTPGGVGRYTVHFGSGVCEGLCMFNSSFCSRAVKDF